MADIEQVVSQKDWQNPLVYQRNRINAHAPHNGFVSEEDAVQNLLDHKIDLLYISEELLLTYIQDHQINTIEYAQSKLNPIDVPLSFAMTEDNKILQSILNKSIKSSFLQTDRTQSNHYYSLQLEQHHGAKLSLRSLACR